MVSLTNVASRDFSRKTSNSLKTDSRSTLSQLSSVVSSGIQTLLWAGDCDYICNFIGGQAVAEAVSWSGQSAFQNMALSSYTVNGNAGGLFKTVENLSWIQVYGAGHEVPYYSTLH